MRKLFIKLTAALTCFLVALIYAVGCTDVSVSATESKISTYLVVGLDDAAQNTDIIMLVGCDTVSGELTFLQIPRDTYYDYGGGQNKINGVFSSYRNRGMSEREALGAFASDISECFGIDISASFAVTIDAFLKFVDKLGGVRINMPHSFTFTDEYGMGGVTLNEGENLLSADMSERFVRYRRGYSLGDLSRIDAQKIFFSGVVKTVLSKSPVVLGKAAYAAKDSIYANCRFSDIVKILAKKPGRNKKLSCKFATLPGEALLSDNGISYYCANRKNAQTVLFGYFSATDFDKRQLLLNKNGTAFYSAYFDENAGYREYTDGTLADIRLK